MIASIIVCTYDRPASLGHCLESLRADRSQVEREVLVIDNFAGGTAEQVVSRAAASAGDVAIRYFLEPEPGQSRARNRGVAEARGELLLFTDDDVLVQDGWADAMVAAFEEPGTGAAGGRVLPRWPHPPPAWMEGPHAERLTLPDFGPEPRAMDESCLPVGANMAVRASIARAHEGPFQTRLGMRGRLKLDAEERHFLLQIAAHHHIAYRPDAVILHCIEPERIDWDYMRRFFFQAGFGAARREVLEGLVPRPFPRRVLDSARACRAAWRKRRANARLSEPGADEAWEEFYGYAWAGKHLEMLLCRFPRVADWVALHGL